MFRAGEVLGGDFEILQPLSQGGMGAVFLARQLSTDTLRALKVMLPEWSQRAELRVRFEREAKVSGRIPSEHVVKIVAYGIDPERQIPWLAMEYLRGSTLEDALNELGVPPAATAFELLRQLFHGVAAAHSLGVVHRDLKPGNVFVAESQRADAPFTVKTLDFGIAKILGPDVSATQAMGTHAWKAPEQDLAGSNITPAADVWALGLLVFWLLNGRPFWLWADEAPSRLSYEVHFAPIPSASARSVEYGHALLGADFDAWVSHCVERDPARRFHDARACWHALEPILRALPAADGRSAWFGAANVRFSSDRLAPQAQAAAPATRSVRPDSVRTTAPTAANRGPHAAPDSPTATQPAQLDARPSAAPRPRSSLKLGLGALLGGALVALWFSLRPALPVPTTLLHAFASSATPQASVPEVIAPPRTSAAPVALATPVAPVGMVYVPPGSFEMGSDDPPPQGPARSVQITRGFFLDQTEVTVQQYTRCVVGRKCNASGVHGPSPELDDPEKYGKYCNADRPGHSLHPINCIDRRQALAVCQFLGKRLPSEAEWEYAARGSDRRKYPWGNDPP
ncbi:MAG: SUMF1/EgtB/PvdO family nonheme iron enzyme, partial [Polyangiaceae bacterium]